MTTFRMLSLVAASALRLAAQTTVLSHATVIDGSGGAPLLDYSMVISGNRIAQLGPAGKVKAPAGAQVIDETGKIIVPGIINLHAHINANTAPKLRIFAHYGVTSIAGMGGDGQDVLDIRAAQRRGDIKGSRVFTVLDRFEFEKDAPTVAIARARVDELKRRGADAIKIVVDDRRGTQAKLKPEISVAVIQEAHKNHLKVFAHIHDYSDAKFLVENGVDVLAHQVRDREVDDTLISEIKKRGVAVINTMSGSLAFYIYAESPVFLSDPFLLKWAAPERIEKARTVFKEMQLKDPAAGFNKTELVTLSGNLRKMLAAGVTIAFGNDDGNSETRFEGYWEHMEMELMVKNGGMTPMQVIQSWSRTNSEVLGISKDYGTLAKGKVADLIVLDKNPLDDILNTRTINTVYLNGKRFE